MIKSENSGKKNKENPKPNAFCTIIAKNYLSYARTLAQSLFLHNPDVPCFVLIADKINSDLDKNKEIFKVVEADELDIEHFDAFSFKYNVVEFSTGVKPYFIDFLFKKYKFEKVVYLDPDIYVYQPLDYLFKLMEKYSLLLIPHITRSFPVDGKGMIDRHILLAGIYNLGFVGIRNNKDGEKIIRWWKDKLYEECKMDPANGLCVDQRWMDFAPVMFDQVHIIYEPGYNVAYWNLHERKIISNDNVWYCNGKLLYFYHFSGVQIDKLSDISKYQNRFNLSNRKELIPLFECYKEKLLFHDYYKTVKLKYFYDYYHNGMKIKEKDRKRYYSIGPNRHEICENPFNSLLDTWLKVNSRIVKNDISKIRRKIKNSLRYISDKGSVK